MLEVGKIYLFPFSAEEIGDSISSKKESYKVFYEESEKNPHEFGIRVFYPSLNDSNVLLFLEKRQILDESGMPKIWEFRFLYGETIITSDYIPDHDLELFEQKFKQITTI